MRKAILALAATLVFISCQHQHDHAQDPSEQHSHGTDEGEAISEAVTLYSANYEIFTEYDLLVTGQPSGFLIHITNLDEDYSPFSDGEVEVMIGFSGQQQKENATPGKVQGIFQCSLVPEAAGEVVLHFIVTKGKDMDTLSAQAHIYTSMQEASPAAEPSGLIKYTKEQAWKSQFNVMEVLPETFCSVVKTSGEFLALPGEKQFVTARTEGIVLFSSKNLVQGKYVKKGEELFMLSGEGLAERNVSIRYNIARSNFEKSKSDVQRHKLLLEETIISDKQYLETRNRYINDSIQYHSLKSTVTTTGMKVTSPMDGYLHELNVSEGQYVEPGKILVTISTNRVMLLRADVPQQYYQVIGEVITANFRPAYSDKVYTIEELNGRLMSKGASVAENNHYLPIYFEVQNDGSLLEGAFAEFYLKTRPETGKKVIPVTALIEEQGNYYVYVQVSGESFQKRGVTLQSSDGIHAAISSGLSFGERIVSEGTMLIKTASSSSIPSHSHEH